MSRVVEDLTAKIGLWLGKRASRDTGALDRLCRRLLTKLMTLPEDNDFLRDEWVDSDQGYDPDELDRYQRGESSGEV